MSGSQPTPESLTLKGVAAAPGAVAGPALVYQPSAPAALSTAPAGDPEQERKALREALAAAAEQSRALAASIAERGAGDEAGIFEAQALMLEDPAIIERAEALITEGQNAAAALSKSAEEQAETLAGLPDPLWQSRAADVRDAARRALRLLAPHAHAATLPEALAALSGPAIVIASDLAPSDTAQAPPERLLGIALARGGPTSHAAILARALGIPAVTGLGPRLLEAVRNGDPLALDGAAGEVILRPSPERLTAITGAAEAGRQREAERRLRTLAWRDRPGATRDGVPIAVMANVGSVAEARAAAEAGAEGVGLLRTEFLFAGRETIPEAEEQATLYEELIAAFGAERGPIVIRTLDAGADKPLPALASYTSQLAEEENPALGVRGVRLSLRFAPLLDTQLEGIALAAARSGADVRVMLPMVATVEEIEAARNALALALVRLEAIGQAPRQPLTLGIMVETPAAALHAEALAAHAAFFSIGSNDLAQYVMAADRLSPELTETRRPEQPALLRAIHAAARAGEAGHIPVAVCGEMAGDPTLAALLAGLGVTELSMAPDRITPVKESLAAHTLDDLRALAARAMRAETLAAARRVIDELEPGG
jgi:phosphoenolpyruvate-protein phosphotransferase